MFLMVYIILGVSVIAVFGLFAYMKAKTEQRQEERRERLEQKQEELMQMLQKNREEREKPAEQ